MTKEERKAKRKEWWEKHQAKVIVGTCSLALLALNAGTYVLGRKDGYDDGYGHGEATGWYHSLFWAHEAYPDENAPKKIIDTMNADMRPSVSADEIVDVVTKDLGIENKRK